MKISRINKTKFTFIDFVVAFLFIILITPITVFGFKPSISNNWFAWHVFLLTTCITIIACLYKDKRERKKIIIISAFPIFMTFNLAKNYIESDHMGLLLRLYTAICLILFLCYGLLQENKSSTWVKALNFYSEIFSGLVFLLTLTFTTITIENYDIPKILDMADFIQKNSDLAKTILYAIFAFSSAPFIAKILTAKKELDDTLTKHKEILLFHIRSEITHIEKLSITEPSLKEKFSIVEDLLSFLYVNQECKNSNQKWILLSDALQDINEMQDYMQIGTSPYNYTNRIATLIEEYIIADSNYKMMEYIIPDREPSLPIPFDSMTEREQLKLFFSAYMRSLIKRHNKTKALVS